MIDLLRYKINNKHYLYVFVTFNININKITRNSIHPHNNLIYLLYIELDGNYYLSLSATLEIYQTRNTSTIIVSSNVYL